MMVWSQDRLVSVLAVVVATAAMGCGGASAETTAALEGLRREVATLKASAGVLSERLDALEIKAGALTAKGPAPSEPTTEAPPELPVVKLGPGTAVAAPPPEVAPPSGPRVRIKSTPNGLVQEETTSEELPPVDASKISGKPKPKPEPPKPTPKKPEKR